MIDDLNAQFAIGDALTFTPGQGGLPRATILTDACRGEVYLHGAHVTRWHPAGHDEVLWMSQRSNFVNDGPIRGGIPLCFPWFAGNKPADQPKAPNHGYARTRPWQVVETDSLATGVTLTLGTVIGQYELTYRVDFGQELHLALCVTNKAAAPQTYEEALHTYFTVSQIKAVEVTGLSGANYLNTVGGANTPHTQDDTPITFDRETDRIYQSAETVVLHDTGLSRAIHIVKGNSRSTVVWNPWVDKAAAMADFGDDEWPGMLCLESANIRPNTVTLAPGESHTMTTTLRIEKTTA